MRNAARIDDSEIARRIRGLIQLLAFRRRLAARCADLSRAAHRTNGVARALAAVTRIWDSLAPNTRVQARFLDQPFDASFRTHSRMGQCSCGLQARPHDLTAEIYLDMPIRSAGVDGGDLTRQNASLSRMWRGVSRLPVIGKTQVSFELRADILGQAVGMQGPCVKQREIDHLECRHEPLENR